MDASPSKGASYAGTNQVRATRANVKGFRLNPLQMFFHMEQVSLE